MWRVRSALTKFEFVYLFNLNQTITILCKRTFNQKKPVRNDNVIRELYKLL